MKNSATVMVVAIVGVWIGYSAGKVKATLDHEAELIERGLAIHCPLDGRVAFTGECVKEITK